MVVGRTQNRSTHKTQKNAPPMEHLGKPIGGYRKHTLISMSWADRTASSERFSNDDASDVDAEVSSLDAADVAADVDAANAVAELAASLCAGEPLPVRTSNNPIDIRNLNLSSYFFMFF